MSSSDETPFLESAIESISSYEMRRHLEHLRFLDDAVAYVIPSPDFKLFIGVLFCFSVSPASMIPDWFVLTVIFRPLSLNNQL